MELEWEQEHIREGRYSLNMIKIDEEIRKTINHIKFAENKIAFQQIKVENAAPEFSVAS